MLRQKIVRDTEYKAKVVTSLAPFQQPDVDVVYLEQQVGRRWVLLQAVLRASSNARGEGRGGDHRQVWVDDGHH